MRLECLSKVVVLPNLIEKHLCWSLFFIKLQACNFIKKRLQHRCFPVKSAKFFKTLFLQNTSGGCFCKDKCHFLSVKCHKTNVCGAEIKSSNCAKLLGLKIDSVLVFSRTINNIINSLHKQRLKLIYIDKTSSFEDFLEKDRSKNVKSINHEIESISYLGPKIWQIVSNEIKNLASLNSFN